MRKIFAAMLLATATAVFAPATAMADDYAETIRIFREAPESGTFFNRAFGYAVFPTIGRAGIGLGGAHGSGRVFVNGEHVGNTRMTQVTLGLQLGAQAYSQIIFFEDERAFREFTSGNFEFGAQAQAIAITATAGAQAGTQGGVTAGAAGSRDEVASGGTYYRGMAVFTVAKGGLMYEASIGGQKFSYTRR